MGKYYCLYHNKYHDSNHEESDNEHVIPKSFGGSDNLTIVACKKSNNELGSDIDKPFGDLPIIAIERHRLHLTGHSGKDPDLEFYGEVELEGVKSKAVWTISSVSPDKDKFRFYPIIDRKEDGETVNYTIRCAPGDEKEILDKITKREAQRGRPVVTPGTRTEGSQANPEFTTVIQHNQQTLRQGFAKMALAFGHYILGDEFSQLPDINHIREFIWERDPAKISKTALHGYFWPSEKMVHIEETSRMPDLHFLALHNAGMLAFTGFLFGKYGCMLRLSLNSSRFTKVIHPLEGVCVWINPSTRKMERGSMIEYLARVQAYKASVKHTPT